MSLAERKERRELLESNPKIEILGDNEEYYRARNNNATARVDVTEELKVDRSKWEEAEGRRIRRSKLYEMNDPMERGGEERGLPIGKLPTRIQRVGVLMDWRL